MIKRFIKLFIPQKYFYLAHATKEYFYDIKRFAIHSNTYYFLDTQEKFNGYLTLQYHVIEKGLTMPQTRLGFGKKAVLDLIETCRNYQSKNLEPNSLPYQHTIKVLKEYIKFHDEHSHALEPEITDGINEVAKNAEIKTFSEQLQFTSQEYFKYKDAPFDKFCRSRYTARNFIDKEIPIPTLMECVDLAKESPSACNRQPNRVYMVNDKEKIKSVLKLQSGNRGFGDLSQSLLIVTSDVSVFQSHKERSEPAFNAGLFSMSLVYALHFHGIGACMLNWSSSKENDMELRRLINVPDKEKITVIIACGYLPETFKIARSPRMKTEEITFAR